MILITQGVHPDVIENLTLEQSVMLWKAWTDGVYGDFGRAREAHMTYSMLHNLTDVLIAVNSKSKKTPKKPDGFDKVFPELWKFATGEDSTRSTALTAKDTWVKLGMIGDLPGA